MIKRIFRVLAAMLLCCAALWSPESTHAGGWSLLTVNRMPDVLEAGVPAEFAISVRQHGVRLWTSSTSPWSPGSSPTLRFAHQSGASVRATTQETSQAGIYTATVVLTRTGVWTLINEEIGIDPAISLTVYSPRAAAMVRIQREQQLKTRAGQRALGRRLFVSKGCYACHYHSAIKDSGDFATAYGVDGAPPLYSSRQWGDAYLRLWLADPAAIKPGTGMPNLGLSEAEIEALSAFLSK